MIKIIRKNKIALISILLVLVCSCVYFATTFLQTKQITNETQTVVRTVEISKNAVDYQSILDEFEDAKLDTIGNITNFEGVKTFNLADFIELDLVSDTNVEDFEVKIKYRYEYDKEAKIISLSATYVDEDGMEIVDTLIGVPFVDENGNLDAVFDCDGEYMLLSELQDAGMIENCGWLKNLFKKVTQIAKKVVTTVATFVYENADVFVPLAIGVIGGLTGGAAIPILLAGAAAGAVIDGTKTAVQSYQQTGNVDWVATGISAGIGAAVGLVATVTGYSIGSTLRSETEKTYNTNKEFQEANGSANNSSVKYGNAGTKATYEWHHIVEQNQIGKNNVTSQSVYSTHNTISLGYETHRMISGIYSSNVENLLKYNIDGLIRLFANVEKGITVRSYLSTLPFEQQFSIGIEILKLIGVSI